MSVQGRGRGRGGLDNSSYLWSSLSFCSICLVAAAMRCASNAAGRVRVLSYRPVCASPREGYGRENICRCWRRILARQPFAHRRLDLLQRTALKLTRSSVGGQERGLDAKSRTKPSQASKEQWPCGVHAVVPESSLTGNHHRWTGA